MTANILIVEDEPIIAEDLRMIVSKAGYNVCGIANDGLRALDLLHSNEVDLALLDIALEGQINGIEIGKVINEKYRIPFIFITSYADELTLSKAQDVLPSGYIVKPFKKKEILANVQISLHRSKAIKKGLFLNRDELNDGVHKDISEKEYELILDISRGLTNLALSEKHGISLNTIKTHLKRIFAKLDVANRSEAVARLIRSE